MLLDYRWLWEEGPPRDEGSPTAHVDSEVRSVRPPTTYRAIVEPEVRSTLAS